MAYGRDFADDFNDVRGGSNTTLHGQMVLAFPVVKDKIDVQMWSKDVYYAVQKAVFKLGQETRDAARKLCPIDTGALKASIYVTSPASRVDQEDNKPYGRAGAPGKASAGYRRAVETSARIMGHLENGETLASVNASGYSGDSALSSPFFGSATLRPKKAAQDLGLTRGVTTRQYRGKLRRPLGERTFENYAASAEILELPFTPMPMSTKEQFWVTVGAAAYYAGFVEFGTSQGQKAQPFLGPAVRVMEQQLSGRIKAAMETQGVKNPRVKKL